MSCSVSGVQLNRAKVEGFRARPIPIVTPAHQGERRMGFRGMRIEFDGSGGCLAYARHSLFGAHEAVIHEEVVCVGQTGVSEAGLRICIQGCLEILDAPFHVLRSPAVPVVAALEVEIVTADLGGRAPQRAGLTRRNELEPQRAYDRARDLLLNREDVVKAPVEGLAPEIDTGSRIDKL